MQSLGIEPLKEFFDVIKAKETRRKYQAKLAKFLDYAGAKGGSLTEKARWFADAAIRDPHRTTITITEFLLRHWPGMD